MSGDIIIMTYVRLLFKFLFAFLYMYIYTYTGLGACCSSLLIITHHHARYYPLMRTNAHENNYAPNSRPKLPPGAHTQPKFRPKFRTPKLHIVQKIGKNFIRAKFAEI
jgi:hypothetical protein